MKIQTGIRKWYLLAYVSFWLVYLCGLNACVRDTMGRSFDLGKVEPFDFINLSEHIRGDIDAVFEIRGEGEFRVVGQSFFLMPDLKSGSYKAVGVGNELSSFQFEIVGNVNEELENPFSIISNFLNELKAFKSHDINANCSVTPVLRDSVMRRFKQFEAIAVIDNSFKNLYYKSENLDFSLYRIPEIEYGEDGIYLNGKRYENLEAIDAELLLRAELYQEELINWKLRLEFIRLNNHLFSKPKLHREFLNYVYFCHYMEFYEFVVQTINYPTILTALSDIGAGVDTIYGNQFYNIQFEYATLQSWEDPSAANYNNWRQSLLGINNYFRNNGLLPKDQFNFGLECIHFNKIDLPFINHIGLSIAALISGTEDSMQFVFNEFGNNKWRPVFYVDEFKATPKLYYSGRVDEFFSAKKENTFIGSS